MRRSVSPPTRSTTTSSSSSSSSMSTSSSSFDLRSYISRYDAKSETRIQRLLFLARSGISPTAAYGMLERQLKEAGNYVRYKEVFGRCPPIGGMDGDCVMAASDSSYMVAIEQEELHAPSKYGFKFDASFATVAFEDAHQKYLTLESNLNAAQSLLSKECIRQSYLDLAQLCTTTGKIHDALNYIRRAKEYSSSSYQIQDITLLMAEAGLNSHNYMVVSNLYDPNTGMDRGGNSRSVAGDSGSGGGSKFLSMLNAARGVAYLAEGSYRDSANSFLGMGLQSHAQGSADLKDDFNQVLSAHDVALYGGLMTLLTLTRSEIASTFVNKETPFRERLEAVPLLRDAIRCYVGAEYGECLKLVDRLRGDWEKDIYLQPHAKRLWRRVRGKCLVQYFEPYSAISLHTMAEAFAFESVDEAEETVVELIELKEIVGAKIQGVERTLTKFSVSELEENKRKRLTRKLGRLGDGLLDEVEGMMLRIACLENNVIIGQKGGVRGKSRSRRRDWGVAMSKDAWGLNSSDDEELTPMEADEDILMDTD